MSPDANKNQPPKPIQDIAPPHDSLGNPEEFADIPVKAAPEVKAQPENRILAAAHSHEEPEAPPAGGENLDKVLKDVNKEVKAAIKTSSKPSKPTLIIIVTVLVTLILAVAAYSAFKKS